MITRTEEFTGLTTVRIYLFGACFYRKDYSRHDEEKIWLFGLLVYRSKRIW